MGFKHHAMGRLDAAAQGHGLGWDIVDHLVVIKLDAGLRHEADHARPGILDAVPLECLTMHFDRGVCRLRRRNSKPFQVLMRAAGYRYLRTDDIDRWLTT